jgi:hypothetical protein
MNLESRRPSGPLFRVGRDDDAWAVPDWAYAKEDGTFGNRFDDPMGVYRVPVAPITRTFIVFSVCGPVPLLNLIRIKTALSRISTLRGPSR